MSLRVRDEANVSRAAAFVKVRDSGNALRTATFLKARNGSVVLKSTFSAMSASASPVDFNAYQSSSSPIDITTGQATASPQGGVAPFTYAWSSATGWTVVSPAAATTGFRADDVPAFESASATFDCTITDSTGASAVNNQINATATNLGGGGIQP